MLKDLSLVTRRLSLMILVTCHLLLISCGGRNPNLSKKQIQTALDSLQVDESTPETASYDPGNIPAGARNFPVRQATPPPIRIDFVEGINHVKDIALSEIASDIVHIKLEHHPDIQFQIFDISLVDEGLLARGLDGIFLFDLNGKFLRQVIANKHNAQYPKPGRKAYSFSDFNGVTDSWYNPATRQLMCFAMSFEFKTIHHPDMGFAVVKMSQDVTGEIPSAGSLKEYIPLSGSEVQFTDGKIPVGFGNGFAAIHYETPNGKECITFGMHGDTLCRFPIFSENEHPYKDKSLNNPPEEMHYYYNNSYTFRNLYNDTVFRIPSANVIQPAYVFDFGKHRLTPKAVYERPNELADYLICSAVCEDDQYLYVRFCKGFDSPNNRKKDKVKFWWGLYHKSTGSFSVLPVNSSNPDTGGITNDLDGGMPFWPRSVDAQGRKIALTPGMFFRAILTDDWFARSKATDPGKKDQLRNLVKTLTDDDWVVTIVR